jgi:hypothetical protein
MAQSAATQQELGSEPGQGPAKMILAYLANFHAEAEEVSALKEMVDFS